jgi:hypothetical protein
MKPVEELEHLWAEHQEFMPLLPILEYAYPDVLLLLSKNAILETSILEKIILYSLGFGSDYWTGLALDWIDSGFAINFEISEKLVECSSDKSNSQNIRHRSLKLGRVWLRENDK